MTERSFNPIWTERYRPKCVADTILPMELKETLDEMVKGGSLQHLIAVGGPGIGKTTALLAMVNELKADYIFVNGSLNRGIDTVRNEIQDFASSVSFSGGRKYIILDEADNLTMDSQLGLRSFIETYSNNTSFLLTCNYIHRLDDAIRSRCVQMEFKFPKNERPMLAKQMYERSLDILTKEKIEFDKDVIIALIKRFFPDFRKTLNELQRYSVSGRIDRGLLDRLDAVDMTALFNDMREKNFTAVRRWCGENTEHDALIYRKLYDKASELFAPKSIPELVLILARYQYQAAFVMDKEVNLAACMAEIMGCMDFVA